MGLVLSYIFQMSTGSLSSIASFLMTIMIVTSPKKLTTPFRRIIFGLSIGDILQSIAFIMGPLSSPSDTPHKPWDIGTQLSCDVQGFIFHTGAVMVIIYTFSLCVYYLYAVKYNTSDKEFGETIERKLHMAAIVYPLATSTFYLAAKSINSSPEGHFCFMFEKPYGCNDIEHIDCVRGSHAANFVLYLTFIPVMLVCVGMSCTLGALCMHVLSQEKRNNRRMRQSFLMPSSHSPSVGGLPANSTNGENQNENGGRFSQRRRSSLRERFSFTSLNSNTSRRSSFSRGHPRRGNSSASSMYVTRGEKIAQRRRKQTMVQAVLYVGCYSLVYTLPLISHFAYYRRGKYQPIGLTTVEHALFPIGGLFNILIYTRPKVSALQRRQKISWFRAFSAVIRAGGDMPKNYRRRRRSSTASSSHRPGCSNHPDPASQRRPSRRVSFALPNKNPQGPGLQSPAVDDRPENINPANNVVNADKEDALDNKPGNIDTRKDQKYDLSSPHKEAPLKSGSSLDSKECAITVENKPADIGDPWGDSELDIELACEAKEEELKPSDDDKMIEAFHEDKLSENNSEIEMLGEMVEDMENSANHSILDNDLGFGSDNETE